MRRMFHPVRVLLTLVLLGLAGCQLGTTAPVPASDRFYTIDTSSNLFQPSTDGIAALDVRDGATIWRYTIPQADSVYISSSYTYVNAAFSPFATDDIVYAGFDAKRDTTLRGALEAVDAATGRALWRHEAGVELSGVPAISGGVVYLSSRARHFQDEIAPPAGLVEALDARHGTVLWRVSVVGLPSLLIVTDGRVIVATYRDKAAGHVLALDAASGRQIWDYAGQATLLPDALPPPLAGHAVVVRELDNSGDIYLAIDTQDGNVMWKYPTSARTDALTPAGGDVCVTSLLLATANNSTAVALIDAATGRAHWSDTVAGQASGCAVSADSVYLRRVFPANGTSDLLALDLTSGRERWSAPMASPLGLQGIPPLLANGDVCVLTSVPTTPQSGVRDSAVAVVEPSDGGLLWLRDFEGGRVPPGVGFQMVAIDNILIVSPDFGHYGTSLLAYSLRDGRVLWQR